MASVIKHIRIDGLWGKYNVNWENLDPAVNILIGINGSGKSTMLNMLAAIFSKKNKVLAKAQDRVKVITGNGRELTYVPCDKNADGNYNVCTFDEKGNPVEEMAFNFLKINTFDIPVEIQDDRRINNGKSQLLQELEDTLYQTGSNKPTFANYRLKATFSAKKAIEVNENIAHLFNTINRLFEWSEKTVEIDEDTNDLVFHQNGTLVALSDLSSGEKQMLLILFKVFLMEKHPYVLLMDEPEISLDIEWQQQLIDVIRELNPNCQLIVATHSPSIFGEGWGDKIVFMDDIATKVNVSKKKMEQNVE